MGLASAPDDGSAVHAIIGTADARMYEVKSERARAACGERRIGWMQLGAQ